MPDSVKFGRRYQAIFAIPSQLIRRITPASLVSPEFISQGTTPRGAILDNGDFLDFKTIPPQFYEINDLQIKAKINQAKEQGSSQSQVEIINLPDEIVNILNQDTMLILRAGYDSDVLNNDEEELPDIFVGQIRQSESRLEGVDFITTLKVGEAISVQRNVRVSKSYPPNTTRKEVVLDLVELIKRSGIPVGRIIEPQNTTREYTAYNSPYYSGYSCQGKIMTELEDVCRSCGMRSFVALGKLYIEPVRVTQEVVVPLARDEGRSAPSSAVIYNITPDNVKGEVTKIDGDSDKEPSNKDGNSSKKQITLSLYLDGRIDSATVISLSDFSGEIDGEYRIDSLVHKMDFRGTDWNTDLALTEL